MSDEIVALLDKAADHVEQVGFTREVYYDTTDPKATIDTASCCIVGAIRWASGYYYADPSPGFEGNYGLDTTKGPLITKAGSAVRAVLLDRGEKFSTDVMTWNDEVATEAAEVVELLRAAARRREVNAEPQSEPL